jgi:hypothetical protein
LKTTAPKSGDIGRKMDVHFNWESPELREIFRINRCKYYKEKGAVSANLVIIPAWPLSIPVLAMMAALD